MRLIKCQPFNRCIQLNGEDSSIRRHHASSLLHPSFIDAISISLLTTILSLIAQQYQLNHVPPDSSYSLFLCTFVYPNEPIRSFPSSKRSRKSSGEFQRLLLSKFFFELAQKNSSLSSMQVSNPWSNYITKNSGINSLYSKWKMTMVNESVGNLTW